MEVGCGDGRAFELYPAEVERVLAVEPDPTARELAAERARGVSIPIEIVDGVAESLPADDAGFDAGVVVWLLCSVDAVRARSGQAFEGAGAPRPRSGRL